VIARGGPPWGSHGSWSCRGRVCGSHSRSGFAATKDSRGPQDAANTQQQNQDGAANQEGEQTAPFLLTFLSFAFPLGLLAIGGLALLGLGRLHFLVFVEV
jgi:hypothetical protein